MCFHADGNGSVIRLSEGEKHSNHHERLIVVSIQSTFIAEIPLKEWESLEVYNTCLSSP